MKTRLSMEESIEAGAKPEPFDVTITRHKASINGVEVKSIEQFQSLLRKRGVLEFSSSLINSSGRYNLSISEGAVTFNEKSAKDLAELQTILRRSGIKIVNNKLTYDCTC